MNLSTIGRGITCISPLSCNSLNVTTTNLLSNIAVSKHRMLRRIINVITIIVTDFVVLDITFGCLLNNVANA